MIEYKNMKSWIYTEKEIHRTWFEKIKKGDKKIDGRDWYFLIYERKMKIIIEIIKEFYGKKILDCGCGEGVLVEEFKSKGYDIEGIDKNYESEFVKAGDITNMEYPDNQFDVVLLLDVLEHLPYNEQYSALKEIKRVLKNQGTLILSMPNIANMSARLKLLILGELSRTDKDYNHLGERTFKEIKRILIQHNFSIKRLFPITPTLPIIWQIITLFPNKMRKIHDLINLIKTPQFALLNIFVCTNQK